MSLNVPTVSTNFTRCEKANHSCEACHRRKVRCDINTFGSPCTNCRLDRHRCEKRAPLKRGRKSRSDRDVQRPVSSLRPDMLEGTSGRGTVLSTPSDEIIRDSTAPLTEISGLQPQRQDVNMMVKDVLVPFYYHNYLQRADIRHLSPEQVQFLEGEGCFKVPSGRVLHEFVRHYFLYVHPCLPVLNEASFWSGYSSKAENDVDTHNISLTLFQAILFAASRFVQPKMIESCGFKDVKHARASFHRRAELLLNNKVERDVLTVAQTSLLLSLQSTMEDQSLNSTWLARAIGYAKLADAHKYYHSAQQIPGTMLEKKKLLWCCILRDRMITLGVRRNIQITPSDFDFDQGGLDECDFIEEQNNSQVYNATTKMMLTRIIVAQCELAVAQTSTMMAAYKDTGQNSTPDVPSVSHLVTSITGIERAKTELTIWARRFSNLLMSYADRNHQAKDTSASVAVFADMTLIHYFSTLVALCNHHVSVLERHQLYLDDYSSRLEDLNSQLKSSIANVANRVKRLSDQGLAHHLPVSAPACTALPFVLEALNLRLATPAQKSTHQKQLDYYTKIMKMFRVQHDHTECVVTAVQNILRVVEPEIGHLLTAAESPQSVSTVNSAGSMSNVPRPSTWPDMLANNPLIYLRLSLFLDFALSRGKVPHVTDLPIWTLGAAATLQAPALSSSLHLMSPSMPQGNMFYNEQPRFVEVGGEEEAGMLEQWHVFNQSASINDLTNFSFADTEIVGAWFNGF